MLLHAVCLSVTCVELTSVLLHRVHAAALTCQHYQMAQPALSEHSSVNSLFTGHFATRVKGTAQLLSSVHASCQPTFTLVAMSSWHFEQSPVGGGLGDALWHVRQTILASRPLPVRVIGLLSTSASCMITALFDHKRQRFTERRAATSSQPQGGPPANNLTSTQYAEQSRTSHSMQSRAEHTASESCVPSGGACKLADCIIQCPGARSSSGVPRAEAKGVDPPSLANAGPPEHMHWPGMLCSLKRRRMHC